MTKVDGTVIISRMAKVVGQVPGVLYASLPRQKRQFVYVHSQRARWGSGGPRLIANYGKSMVSDSYEGKKSLRATREYQLDSHGVRLTLAITTLTILF